MANSNGLRLTSDWLLVELVDPATTTAGGIHVLQTAAYNDTTAVVLAAGPGIACSALGGQFEYRTCVFAQPGNVILAPSYAFAEGPTEKQRFIRDHELYAILSGDDIVPLNDWVYAVPDAADEFHSCGLEIPSGYRRRDFSATVVDWGPGKLRLTGKRRGTRASVSAILNAELSAGDRVWWERKAEPIAVGRHALAGLLIRAQDICAVL